MRRASKARSYSVLPDISVASDTLALTYAHSDRFSHYDYAYKYYDSAYNTLQEKAMTRALYLHKDVTINTTPKMPAGKTEVDIFTGPDLTLTAEPDLRLGSQLSEQGCRQSIKAELMDCKKKVI